MILTEDIAALADDETVMWAIGVLRDNGINGEMYEKLLCLPQQPGTIRQ